MKTDLKNLNYETKIDKMLMDFRKNLYFGENIELFVNKTNAFIAFFTKLSLKECPHLSIQSDSKKITELLESILRDISQLNKIESTPFYTTTMELAELVIQGHLEILEDVTEMIGDYYNNVCAYGLYENQIDISDRIKTENYIDLMDKLGTVYSLTFDKLEELEKLVPEKEEILKEIDDREFE